MGIIGLFKSLGKVLGKALAVVFVNVGKVVTDDQVAQALEIVKQAAANKLWDNTRKRDFAVSRVQAATKLPESYSRWLVETAVLAVKGQAEKGLAEVADLAMDDDEPSASKDAVVEELERKLAQADAVVTQLQAQVEKLKAANAKAKAKE